MCAPFSANAALSFFTTAGELVERSKYAAPAFMPEIRPSGPSATASTSTGSGNEEKITSVWLREYARGVGPDGAGIEMVTCGLTVQIVHDQPEAGLLQVGRHTAAHGAKSDKSYQHGLFGHRFTAVHSLPAAYRLARFAIRSHAVAELVPNFHAFGPKACMRGTTLARA